MMRRIFSTLIVALLLIWGPAYFTGWQATRQAKNLAGENYCWLTPTPSRQGPDLTLTLDPSTPYRFWTSIFRKPAAAGHNLPHFAIAIPNANPQTRVLGWSYKRTAFWSLDEQISALGLFWAPQDCQGLLEQ